MRRIGCEHGFTDNPLLPRRWRLAPLLCALLCWQPAHAATILIWPVRIEFNGAQRAAELWLENRSSMPLTLQVRVLEWHQRQGREQLTAQSALLASPPFSTVPAGGKQLVRLVRTAPPGERESHYRVLIDELPDPLLRAQTQNGVQFQMRYSVPVFVHSTAEPPRQMDAYFASHLHYSIDSQRLTIKNTGDYYARIARVGLSTPGGDQSLSEGLLGYVLPGAEMSWPLSAQAKPGGTLRAEINGVPVTLTQSSGNP